MEESPKPSTPIRRRRTLRAASGPTLSVLIALCLVVAAEVLIASDRIAGLRTGDLDPVTPALADARVGPHPYLSYALRPNFRIDPTPDSYFQLSHNSLGFRGKETTWEKPPGVYRIVCLGGSSTYGFGPTTDETNWPSLLERRLHGAIGGRAVEVINLGAQGYSTFESLIQLSLRGVDLQPDLVLVYHAINDMRCALYPGVVRDNTHWRSVWPVDRKAPSEQLLERSGIYRVWRRYATDWAKERQNLGGYVIVDFGRHGASELTQPTDLNLGFQNFERNLRSIVAVARGHGAEVMLLTQSTRLIDFDRFESAQLERAGFERMTDIIRSVAEELDTHFVDTRSVLEPEADRRRAAEGHDGLFTDTVHLTDRGCMILASLIADEIARLGLIR